MGSSRQQRLYTSQDVTFACLMYKGFDLVPSITTNVLLRQEHLSANVYDTMTKLISSVFFTVAGLALLLSAAGIATSELALTWARSASPSRREITSPDGGSFTGWLYLVVPENLHLGNEQAILGVSITILVLSTFILLAAWGGKIELVRPMPMPYVPQHWLER